MTDQGEDRNRNMTARAILAIGLAVIGLWIVSGFLRSLVWASVLAIAIDPLYVRIGNASASGRHRSLQAAAFTLAVALIVLLPIGIGITEAASDASAVVAWLADIQQRGIPVASWVDGLPVVGPTVSNWWHANLASPQGAQAMLHHLNAANLLEQSRLIGAGILHRVVIFIVTLFALFFLLRDRDSVVRQCRIAGQRVLGARSERILRQTVISVRGTIDGVILVGIGEGAVMAVVYVALGVPHALLISVLTAVAAAIPFGAAVMFVVAAILLIAKGMVLSAIAVIVLGLTVVGIADHFVRPVLIGNATQLPFFWVLIGILGGIEAFGLLGLFVGPAIMTIIFMFWREFAQGDPAQPTGSP